MGHPAAVYKGILWNCFAPTRISLNAPLAPPALTLGTSEMVPVFTTPMQNSENDDGAGLHKIEELVRKPPSENATKTPMVDRVAKRVLFQPHHSLRYRCEKLIAKSRALLLIPISSIQKVTFCGFADGNEPTHLDDVLRIRAIASRQGAPTSLSFSNAANSRSRSAVSTGSGSTPSSRLFSSISQSCSKISRRSSGCNRGSSANISLLLTPKK